MTEFTIESSDRLRRSVGDLVRTIQRGEGMPGGLIETLGFLVREGPQSIAQLARLRRIRHQSMSSAVTELEARGLVARSPDPADGRSLIIVVTDAGTALVEKSRADRSSVILHAAHSALTPDELDTLSRAAAIFDKVRLAIEAG